MAIFLDLILVGEAEEVLTGVLRTVGRMKAEGRARAECRGFSGAQTSGARSPPAGAAERGAEWDAQ